MRNPRKRRLMKKLMIKWIGEYKAKLCFGVSARTRALHARSRLACDVLRNSRTSPYFAKFSPNAFDRGLKCSKDSLLFKDAWKVQ